MIFYGTKGVHLKSERISGVKCNHCEQQTSHTISIYGKYFYVYWIPIFPLSKKGFSECDHCKVTLEPKQMSEQLRLKYDNIKRETKTPITHWAGLAIIALIIAYAFYASSKHDKDVVTFIENPQKGDVVEYKPNDYYSTLKVASVTNDSVFLLRNKYEIQRQSKLYKIDKTKNYSESPYGVSRTEYKELFNKKEFLDVDR